MNKKQFLLISLIFLISVEFSSAQKQPEKKFSYLVEVGILPRLGKATFNDQHYDLNGGGTTVRFTTSYAVNKHFTIGLGLGTDNFRKPEINTLPVFADFRGVVSPNRRSLLGFYKIGYSFKIGDVFDEGFVNNLGLGYQLPLGNNFLVPSIGFHRIDFKIKDSENIDKATGSINSLSIGLGFQF